MKRRSTPMNSDSTLAQLAVLYEEPRKEAEEILNKMRGSIFGSGSTAPFIVSPLTMECLIQKVEEDTEKFSEVLRRIKKSNKAKKPRYGRKEKEKRILMAYWLYRKFHPETYGSDSEFKEDMLEKTGIKRRATLDNWINKLRKGARLIA